ncbi:capsular polysaccharide biosynthesis protein [Paenibacillus sp. CR_12]|uniref:capsular polysaccharide biosynthesis protein n=1 Tax=Paenibacillus sp. CR_12 TaxID=3055793 RepID=UPI0035C254E1
MIGIYSKGIAAIPFLESFLQDEVILNPTNMENITKIAGWGKKPSAMRAIKKAEKYDVPYLSLEDGFIRSIQLGVKNRQTLSLIADPIGIYYDATTPSQLEDLLNQGNFTGSVISEARECLEYIQHNKISKYNHTLDSFKVKRNSKENILLVDQTLHDMSVSLGLANESTFQEMFRYALETYPDANIYIKYHPDVIAGKKKGYLSELSIVNDRVTIINVDTNPIELIEQMDRVLVVTSQLGFEALMLNKNVSCFGLPFYASWGLTTDSIMSERRVQKRTVEELFAASYLLYPSYIRPQTGIPGSLMDVLTYINKEKNQVQAKTKYYFLEFPKWKRNFVRPFFPESTIDTCFLPKNISVTDVDHTSNHNYVVWSYGGEKSYKIPDNSLIRIEDGFYRSVGLGSNFHEPWSLVIDEIGIYFNSQQPSKLEYILNNKEFDEYDIKEAKLIQQFILDHSLTKYNVDYNSSFKLENRDRKKIIFVPGQVEDDASIRYGCNGDFRTIEQLLEYLRIKYPEDYILYKPHPDVYMKNRKGIEHTKFCDHIETRASVLQCIQVADEVHTLTSQVGFDSLLQGKKVFTYGGPFYAGWGLTNDAQRFNRRNRVLSIEELIAGTLIYYAKYYNRDLKHLTDCRSVLRKLASQKRNLSYKKTFFDTNKRRWIRRCLLQVNEMLRRDSK